MCACRVTEWAIPLLLLSLFYGSVTGSNNSLPLDFADCSTKLSTLENALYETGDNVFEMNRVFYPPNLRTSRFIRVTYTFLDEMGEDDGCNVTYIWAIGILLFFQPPALFTYNSLYFNYPNNNLTTLQLNLPYECRPLINISSREECSCIFDSRKLDVLTQQLNVYAKFTNLGNVERVNTFARAVCSEELYNIFYSGNHKFNFIIICLTIVMPFVFLVIFLVFVRNVHDDVIHTFTKPSQHGVLVAMVMIGILTSVVILIFDVLACYVVVSGDHEYSQDLRGNSLNLYIVFGTLICDTLFFLPLLLSIIYIMAFNGRSLLQMYCKCNIEISMQNFLTGSVIYLLIGKKTLEKIRPIAKDDTIAILFPAMLITPLLCFASHTGYIMLAWLTEPSKCTTILILLYLIIVYFYFAFRKSYKHYARTNIIISQNYFNRHKATNRNNIIAGKHYEVSVRENTHVIQLEECPANGEEQSVGKTQVDGESVPQKKKAFDSSVAEKEKYGREIEDGSYEFCCLSCVKVDKKHINTQAFCLMFFYGFLFLCVLVMMISIIIILPLSSEELVTYLFSIFQLTVVVISTQYAYDLYFSSSFSIKHVLKKFREVFALKRSNQNLVDIARDQKEYSEIDDAAGAFAAEITDIIIQKLHAD